MSSSAGSLIISKSSKLSKDGPLRLILASKSPRRREILDMMGLKDKYIVLSSPLNEEELQLELSQLLNASKEDSTNSFTPIDYTKKLAESKAYALVMQMVDGKSEAYNTFSHRCTYVLGSDTIVDLDGSILEKPKNSDDAKMMLSKLSGNWHSVHTGVAIYRINHENQNEVELVSSFTDTARVLFTHLSSEDIDSYIATGEPMDKAGSYGIQGIGGQCVEQIEGDFFSVMGLPMNRVSRELANAI
jgi:septum formation protein